MTEKTALVVMLPLTDEQWRAANAAPYARDKGPMPAIEASIRAIGTPVDSSVPVVGSVAPWQAEAAENGRGWTILHPYGMGAKRHSVNLVRQSNHLAALAETQAETDRRAAAVIAAICRDVSELPDRTSTDDDPSMMTVTQEELELIVRRNILSGAAS